MVTALTSQPLLQSARGCSRVYVCLPTASGHRLSLEIYVRPSRRFRVTDRRPHLLEPAEVTPQTIKH